MHSRFSSMHFWAEMGLYMKSWRQFSWGLSGLKICAMEIIGVLPKTKSRGHVTNLLDFFFIKYFRVSTQPTFFALHHAVWQ
jgi:hypothetical protein